MTRLESGLTATVDCMDSTSPTPLLPQSVLEIAMIQKQKRVSHSDSWQKYAPPLPNKLECLEEAFNSLFPIVRFCPHLGFKAKFQQECTHEGHYTGANSWNCRCWQSKRFTNIFGRYIDGLCQQLPTRLTGTKIKNRAYGFRRYNRRLFFKLRRHPRVDPEYYEETEQRWYFDLNNKKLILLGERQI